MLGYYAAGMVAFYAWHVLAHCSHGAMHELHMRHHRSDYPRDDFYGDRSGAPVRYFGAGPPPTLARLLNPAHSMTATAAHEGPLAGLFVLIIAAGRVVVGSSVSTLAAVAVLYGVMGVVGSALHMSFHVRGFELERFAWYRELRALHYIHHVHKKNYAMVNTAVDLVFGSLQLSLPQRTADSAMDDSAQ